jgi:Tol biopolymer transport system component
VSRTQPKARAVVADYHIETFAVSPDGKTLAVVGNGPRRPRELVRLDLKTGKDVGGWDWPDMSGAVAFAPDGRHLAVGNTDGTVLILRLAEPPK